MTTTNYQGRGIYRHYKGGTYLVHGLVRLEHNETVHVQYETLSPEHRTDAFHRGLIGTVRPLNESDGPDCFNSAVGITFLGSEHAQSQVPRFEKMCD